MSDANSSPQPAAGAPVLEPGAIKVFGILHIVFGGIGIFGFLITVAQIPFREAIMKASAAGDPQVYELQKQINDASTLPTYIGLAIGLVVTVMILRAGLKLVKKKRDAVQASTLYSYVSIGAKVVALILALTLTMPALNEVFDRMGSEAGVSPQVTTMISTMKISMAASSVITPLLMCIYPVLSLVMLKKKNITDYLAQYGK